LNTAISHLRVSHVANIEKHVLKYTLENCEWRNPETKATLGTRHGTIKKTHRRLKRWAPRTPPNTTKTWVKPGAREGWRHWLCNSYTTI